MNKDNPFLSLRWQLVLLLVVAVLPTLALAVVQAGQQRQLLIERASAQSLEVARLISTSQAELIDGGRILLSVLADTPAVRERRVDECNELVARTVRASSTYLALLVADPDGRSWCRYPEPAAVTDSSDLAFFRRAVEYQRFVVGGFQIGRVTGRRILTLGHPVYAEDGALQAVLSVGMDVDELNRRVEALNLPRDYAVAVVDRDATVVISWPAEGAVAIGEPLPAGPLRAAVQAGQSGASAAFTGPDGVERLYAVTAVERTPDRDLTVVVGIALTATLAVIERTILFNLGAGGLLVLAGGLTAWWFGDQRLAAPIRRLADAARRIQSGDLGQRAPAADSVSELTRLVADFNAMAATLQQQALELGEANLALERRVEERTRQLQASLTALGQSREQLRQLSGRQRQMLEDEQTRISREVHDQLGQALTGAKMDLALIERRLTPLAEEPRVARTLQTVHGLVALIDETIQQARAIARRLRPSVLDDLGLVAALEWAARDIGARAGLTVTVTGGETAVIKGEVSTAAYRIVQEALTNVVRHARARTVTLDVRVTDGRLGITIRDDGVGLPAGQAGGASLGMLGMRERAEALGGEVRWEAAPGGGTRVTVCLPLDAPPGPAGDPSGGA